MIKIIGSKDFYTKNLLKSLVFSVIFGGISSYFAVIILQYQLLGNDIERVLIFIQENTKLTLLGVIIIFILNTWLGLIINSAVISGFLLILFSAAIGFISQKKMVYRGEPLYPSDIVFLKDATFFFDFVDARLIYLSVIILVLSFSLLMLYLLKRKNKIPYPPIFRIIGIAITSLLLFKVYNFNQPGNIVKGMFNHYVSWITFSQAENYTKNSFVAGILYNLKSPALEKPNNYSKKEMEEIFLKYSAEANKINEDRMGAIEDVNIIYIMNETFSDIYHLEGIEISGGDALTNYRKLPGQHGLALSQVYGGGTANVEFEALTGLPQEPMNGNVSIPYIHLSHKMSEFPSITQLIEETHKMSAIHPHNSTMYKRFDNYKALGFNNILFKDDMSHSDKIDRNPYISDKSAYAELLQVMENSMEKDFIHLVTMQNHMAYNDKYDNVQFKVNGTDDNAQVEHYLKGITYSDMAIAELIDTFEEYDEKVLIVFWGDHLPALFSDEIKELNGYRAMHETPLLIYSNYAEQSDQIGTISPFYFVNHVLRVTDEKVTPYIAFLHKLEQVLPAFEKKFYLERETGIKENRYELRKSTQLLLNELDLILYDITTGYNYVKEMGFY